jgi:hypothetical protein
MRKRPATTVSANPLATLSYSSTGSNSKDLSRSVSSENDDAGSEAHLLQRVASSSNVRTPPRRRGVCRYGTASITARSFEARMSDEAVANVEAWNAAALSPQRIGPLTGLHRSNNDGTCQLFGNFIVGSVAHRCEFDTRNETLASEFFVRRECLFASSVPRATKFRKLSATSVALESVVDRSPTAFIWTPWQVPAVVDMLKQLYRRLVLNSPIFHELLHILQSGTDVVLLGPTDSVDESLIGNSALPDELWRVVNWEAVVADELNAALL